MVLKKDVDDNEHKEVMEQLKKRSQMVSDQMERHRNLINGSYKKKKEKEHKVIKPQTCTKGTKGTFVAAPDADGKAEKIIEIGGSTSDTTSNENISQNKTEDEIKNKSTTEKSSSTEESFSMNNNSSDKIAEDVEDDSYHFESVSSISDTLEAEETKKLEKEQERYDKFWESSFDQSSYSDTFSSNDTDEIWNYITGKND